MAVCLAGGVRVPEQHAHAGRSLPGGQLSASVRQGAALQAQLEQGHTHVQAVAGLAEVSGPRVGINLRVDLHDGALGVEVGGWVVGGAMEGAGGVGRQERGWACTVASEKAHLVDAGQRVHHNSILLEQLHRLRVDDVLALGALVVVRPKGRCVGV